MQSTKYNIYSYLYFKNFKYIFCLKSAFQTYSKFQNSWPAWKPCMCHKLKVITSLVRLKKKSDHMWACLELTREGAEESGGNIFWKIFKPEKTKKEKELVEYFFSNVLSSSKVSLNWNSIINYYIHLVWKEKLMVFWLLVASKIQNDKTNQLDISAGKHSLEVIISLLCKLCKFCGNHTPFQCAGFEFEFSSL